MKKNKRKERGKGQEMKGRDFYQMIKERQEAGGQTAGSREAGMSELTAATILDGAQAGEKFLLKGEREAQDFAESHAGTGVFMERLGGSPGLLVFGAGHVSMPIIKIGKMLRFSVTVLEDRPKFADQARRAGADRVICEPFSQGLAQAELGPDTYAVIVTRGHRYDEDCLYGILSRERELGTACAYVGMMGSRRRTAMVRERMRELGISDEEIRRLHAPIGLAIGAETPEEIAVSIFAQIIQVKNEKERTEGYPEELLEAILEGYDSGHDGKESWRRAVLATIISRQGSAPRSVGTKMLIREDGTTFGTIGGGCAESRVMQKALQMLRISESPRFLVTGVDMTAQEAEEEGMVCGGRIQVMLEVTGD